MRALAAAAVSAAVLTGCGTDAEAELRAHVSDITAEANERDADGVRTRVEDLLERLDAAVAAGDLAEDRAAALRERALAVQAGADAIDPDVLARQEAERAAQEAQARAEAEAAARAQAEQAAREQAAREQAAREEAERGKGEDDKGDEGKGEDGKGDDGKDDD